MGGREKAGRRKGERERKSKRERERYYSKKETERERERGCWNPRDEGSLARENPLRSA